MAEKSYLWTTGGAGDGSATYTRSDWSIIAAALAACHGMNAVGANYLNKLVGTTAANTVNIATGGAVVDGKPYNNDASVAVTIPSATGGGNTRIDRVVLRANWTAQTVRITRIAGTDAASPTAPAITTTSGTTYDVMLYQALVNTSGAVTLTDERPMANIVTADIANGAITTSKLDTYAAIPQGMISLFDAACPTGWTEYTDASGRVVVGVPSGGTVAGTVGSALTDLATRTINTVAAHTHGYAHTHGTDTQGNHTHGIHRYDWPDSTWQVVGGSAGLVSGCNYTYSNIISTDGAHAHTTNTQSASTTDSAGTATVDVTMPFIQLRYCKKD